MATRDEIFAYLDAHGGTAMALEYLEHQKCKPRPSLPKLSLEEERARALVTIDDVWQQETLLEIRAYLTQKRKEEREECLPWPIDLDDAIKVLTEIWDTFKGPKCEHCGQITKLTIFKYDAWVQEHFMQVSQDGGRIWTCPAMGDPIVSSLSRKDKERVKAAGLDNLTWQKYAIAKINGYLDQMRREGQERQQSLTLDIEGAIQTLIDIWNISKGTRCESCEAILKIEFCPPELIVRREEHIVPILGGNEEAIWLCETSDHRPVLE